MYMLLHTTPDIPDAHAYSFRHSRPESRCAASVCAARTGGGAPACIGASTSSSLHNAPYLFICLCLIYHTPPSLITHSSSKPPSSAPSLSIFRPPLSLPLSASLAGTHHQDKSLPTLPSCVATRGCSCVIMVLLWCYSATIAMISLASCCICASAPLVGPGLPPSTISAALADVAAAAASSSAA
jgi:hypothetical protein